MLVVTDGDDRVPGRQAAYRRARNVTSPVTVTARLPTNLSAADPGTGPTSMSSVTPGICAPDRGNHSAQWRLRHAQYAGLLVGHRDISSGAVRDKDAPVRFSSRVLDGESWSEDLGSGAHNVPLCIAITVLEQILNAAQIGDPRAFSPTVRITQREGRQGTDTPDSRTHMFRGLGRQQEPRTPDEPGVALVPRSLAVSGHPVGSPAVPESVLEPR